MTKQEIRERLIDMIRTVLGQNEFNGCLQDVPINDSTNLSVDLGMDSIEIITIIAEIENAFDIEFDYSDMEIEKITILGNIVQSLEHVLRKNDVKMI